MEIIEKKHHNLNFLKNLTTNNLISHNLTTNKMAMIDWDNSSNYTDSAGKSQILKCSSSDLKELKTVKVSPGG